MSGTPEPHPEAANEAVKRLASAPKTLRQVLMEDPSSEEAKVAAAIELQRYARGYIVRKLGPEVYVAWKGNLIHKETEEIRLSSAKSHHSTRHDVSRKSVRYDANPNIHTIDGRNVKLPMTAHQAATKIQRFWRRHIDMQVYRYYKDLINFKNQGDPAVMLRSVNPKEAALLDAASGTHVKFRLAGERFPPNIYYRIYTHRPIQDLCANAPRDYTKSASKQKDMKCSHNKNYIRKEPETTEDWYRRIENNGWRLVSDRLIPHMLSDPVTWATHNKPVVNFQHNKILRIQDVEKTRKKRKIDWMKKMACFGMKSPRLFTEDQKQICGCDAGGNLTSYTLAGKSKFMRNREPYKDGMLQAKTTDPETVALVEGATSGMVTTIELEGEEAVAEWEVDELLDWTTSLNFEDYVSTWKQVGTSSLSETAAEKRYFLTSHSKENVGPIAGTSSADNSRPMSANRRVFAT